MEIEEQVRVVLATLNQLGLLNKDKCNEVPLERLFGEIEQPKTRFSTEKHKELLFRVFDTPRQLSLTEISGKAPYWYKKMGNGSNRDLLNEMVKVGLLQTAQLHRYGSGVGRSKTMYWPA